MSSKVGESVNLCQQKRSKKVSVVEQPCFLMFPKGMDMVLQTVVQHLDCQGKDSARTLSGAVLSCGAERLTWSLH